MTRAPEPITIALTAYRRTKRAIAAAIGSFVLGVLSIVYAIFGGSGGDGAARTGAIFVAVMLLLFALLLTSGMGIGIGARELVFAEDGLTCGGTARSRWQLRWDELASASVHVGYRGRPVNRNYRVRVELEPPDVASSDFEREHPSLRRLRQRGKGPAVYSLPLGPRRDLIDRLDNAFAIFADRRYAGLADDGPLGGPMAPQIKGLRDPGRRGGGFRI